MTQADQIKGLLGTATRSFVPIGRSFVQNRDQRDTMAGALAAFVTSRQRHALELYLLAHALASAPPYDVNLTAGAWATATGRAPTPSAKVAISRHFTWLEHQKLIRTRRVGRTRQVIVLAEDQSGRTLDSIPLDYLKLPHAYWLDGWHTKLKLPGLALLLIALSLAERFQLPRERGPDWYGLSADTIRRGLTELTSHGLATYRTEIRKAPRSPLGRTEQRVYTLTGPFAAAERRSQRLPPDADTARPGR